MALVIGARTYGHCITMGRAIVECIDVNWNGLILDRIQRQTFVSVEMNLRVTTEIRCSMSGIICCSDKIALFLSFGQSVLWIVRFVSSVLYFEFMAFFGWEGNTSYFSACSCKDGDFI